MSLAPRNAGACSQRIGPPAPPQHPWFSECAFPTNGLFVSSLEWRTIDGQALVFDEALSEALGVAVRVSARGREAW